MSFLILLNLFFTTLYSKEYLQLDCQFFDLSNKQLVKSYSAKNCHIFNDKSRLEFFSDYILFIDSENQIVWKKDVLFHHQFIVSEKDKTVALLGASRHNLIGCQTRFDAVFILNLKDGREVSRLDFFDVLSEFTTHKNKKAIFNRAFFQQKLEPFQCDTTHVNSIFQLKRNYSGMFKKGQWLINVQGTGYIAIFSEDLKKLIWKSDVFESFGLIHDLKVTDEGDLVAYLNQIKDASGKFVSGIGRIRLSESLNASDVKLQRLKTPMGEFYQPICGGYDYDSLGNFYYSTYENGSYRVRALNVENNLIDLKLNYKDQNPYLLFQNPRILDLEEL